MPDPGAHPQAGPEHVQGRPSPSNEPQIETYAGTDTESEFIGGATPYVDAYMETYQGRREPRWTMTTFQPRYREGNQWIDPDFGRFSALPREVVLEIQEQLAHGGFFGQNIGDLHPGVWDAASADAMHDLMEFANFSGHGNWQAALNQLMSSPTPNTANLFGYGSSGGGGGGGGGGGRGGPGGFVADPYVAPDYDTLAQAAKQFMRQALGGRDPRDFEMELLTDRMKQLHRDQYESAVAAAKAQFEVAVGARSPDNLPELVEEDPQASFAEFFEETFAPEIGRLERETDTRESQQRLVQNIAGLRGMT